MIDAPVIIAFLQEREILRLWDALSEASRRRLVLFAYFTYEHRQRRESSRKTTEIRAPKDLSLPHLRRILASVSPAETDRIYRQALALRNAEKKPEGD